MLGRNGAKEKNERGVYGQRRVKVTGRIGRARGRGWSKKTGYREWACRLYIFHVPRQPTPSAPLSTNRSLEHPRHRRPRLDTDVHIEAAPVRKRCPTLFRAAPVKKRFTRL